MPRVIRPEQPASAATLLQLMWLASPALPVGGFSYSEGLESAVEVGSIGNDEQAGDWLIDQLHLSLARGDLPVLHRAVLAWKRGDSEEIQRLNDWVIETRESSEMLLQAMQMGRSMTEWLRNQHDDDHLATLAELEPAPVWHIAYAYAIARTEATQRDTLLAFAFGWAENMVQAAVKAVPLGQNAGQRVLGRLRDAIPSAVAHAMQLADSERQAHTPMLAILSAQHETQYSRLFRS